jgi:hypothetical protein
MNAPEILILLATPIGGLIIGGIVYYIATRDARG